METESSSKKKNMTFIQINKAQYKQTKAISVHGSNVATRIISQPITTDLNVWFSIPFLITTLSDFT